MLFLGEYRVNFTGQGRIVIPKKIREAIGNSKTFVLTKGFDRCLSGFKNKDWDDGVAQLMNVSPLEMEKIEIKRHLFSSATTTEIDDQGRIIIPKNLIEYADLTSKEIVLIGVGTYFEIWNFSKWSSYIKSVEGDIKNIVKNK